MYARKDQTDFHETRLKPTKIGAEPQSDVSIASGIQEGSVIVLDKIVFEPNITTLNQTVIRNLDALFELLIRYPDMNIDLIAHTDTRGNQVNNLAVSKERADNSVSYLEYRGIPASRMKAVGKGGSEPRNQCKAGVECTEEEHLSNVRIEVKVHK